MNYPIDLRTPPAARGGKAAVDPLGGAVRHQNAELRTNVGPIATSRIFLIDSESDEAQVREAAGQLLADPIVERADLVLAGRRTTGGRAGSRCTSSRA